MRLSCLETMLGDLPLAQQFALAQAAGFDGIDLRGDLLRPRVTETTHLIRQTGLAVPSVYARLRSPLLAATLGERAEAMAILRSRLRDAAAVGAQQLVVVPIFGDARLDVQRGAGVQEIEAALLLVLLRELAVEAEDCRVRLVLEPLNRAETHFLTSPSETAALTRHLHHDWVGMMVDFYHMDREQQNAAEEIAHTIDQLRLVHLSDRERALPGTGGLDFAPGLRALRDLGYQGFYGFECAGAYTLHQLRESVQWIRSR
jgi:sugar phosphate isomerase/epimerase